MAFAKNNKVGEHILKKKSTNELTHEILNTSDIRRYIKENEKDFIVKEFHSLLMDIIVEKDLDKKEIIAKSNINRVYFYHLLSGTRKPSRNKMIQLAFGLDLNVEEVQKLLKYSKMKELYSKFKRDAIIIYALSHHMSIFDTEILLEEENEDLICD